MHATRLRHVSACFRQRHLAHLYVVAYVGLSIPQDAPNEQLVVRGVSDQRSLRQGTPKGGSVCSVQQPASPLPSVPARCCCVCTPIKCCLLSASMLLAVSCGGHELQLNVRSRLCLQTQNRGRGAHHPPAHQSLPGVHPSCGTAQLEPPGWLSNLAHLQGVQEGYNIHMCAHSQAA